MQHVTVSQTSHYYYVLLLFQVTFVAAFDHWCHASPSFYHHSSVFLIEVHELVFVEGEHIGGIQSKQALD